MLTEDTHDELVEQVRAFLATDPENGPRRLQRFLDINDGDDGRFLIDTEDVMRLTGWGKTYISRLCVDGTLPHIPGKPHKFIPGVVKATLEQMQIGGMYGRRKSKRRVKK